MHALSRVRAPSQACQFLGNTSWAECMTGSFLKDLTGGRRTHEKNQTTRLEDGKTEAKVINVKHSKASCKDAAWAAKLAWEKEAKHRRPHDPALRTSRL